MIGPYLDQSEMDELNEILSGHILEDTLGCWVRTRMGGGSASMCCDGNISIPLLKAFDTVKREVTKEN